MAERVRLYQGGRGAGGGLMAADASLGEARLAGALRGCYALISRPDALPEFGQLQARPRPGGDSRGRPGYGVFLTFSGLSN